MKLPESRAGWIRLAGLLLLAMLVIVPPFVYSPLELNRFSRDVVLVLAVLGINVLTGHGGLISLGHGVFIGIGAFAMANLLEAGLPLLAAGLGATLIAGTFGIILGLPALRVRGRYLALITFALALAFAPVAKQLSSLTGGSSGRQVQNESFEPPAFLGLDDATHVWRYCVTLTVVVIWFLFARNLIASRAGRAIRAVSQNEVASASFGVNIRAIKTGTLGVSAAMAGTCGAMLAILNPFLLHSEFDAMLSFRIYAAAVLGGIASLAGTVIGTIFLIAVPEVTSRFTFLGNDQTVFGLALVVFTFFAPRGLAGLFAGQSGKDSPERRV